MKKITTVMAFALCAALMFANGGKETGTTTGAFTPEREINWLVTSSPGGGSDIYTRMIADIITKNGFVNQTFLVNNKTDGGGEVGRAQASQTKGKMADVTLLTFNSGDLMPMVKNTPNRIENFSPIAVMAVDKQLVFAGPKTTYTDFKSIVDAVKAGAKVTLGGSKGDDIATYEALITELKLTENQLPFITYDGTGDAITALLGGHVDIIISKPAAASAYTQDGVDASKKLTAILALSTSRYAGNLSNAPTLKEIGPYKDVEVPVWRGVVGPKDMSPQAVTFWSDVLKKVSETEQWKTDYLDKNKLMAEYKNSTEAAKYMKDYQTNYMAQEGIK